MRKIKPFANERDSLEINGLIIENRIDRVSVYGSITITRDKKGLKAARKIAVIFSSIIKQLDSENLPDSLPSPKAGDIIDNPFE